MSVKNSRFNNVSFKDCKLLGIDWTRATWPNLSIDSQLKFEKSVLNDSSFFGLKLPNLKLIECRCIEVDFSDGDFNHGDFSYSDLSASLFRQTNLTKANFAEALNYSIDIENNRITGAKFSRHEAVSLLQSLNIELVD